MISQNIVILTGNLTRDPRHLGGESDRMRVAFTVACDRGSYRDREAGQLKRLPTDFIDVTVWGADAANVLKHKRQGDQVSLHGSLTTQKFTETETGKDVYKLAVRIEKVQFGSRPNRAEGAGPNHEQMTVELPGISTAAIAA